MKVLEYTLIQRQFKNNGSINGIINGNNNNNNNQTNTNKSNNNHEGRTAATTEIKSLMK